MKLFITYLFFQFSCSFLLGQTSFFVTKSDSSSEKSIYLIQYKKVSYLLTLLKDTASSKIIVVLREKKGIDKIIIKQKVELGVSLDIRPFTTEKNPILYIEVGSNVLYAHAIIFSEKIRFKKGSPLKGKYLNKYYSKFLDNNSDIPY